MSITWITLTSLIFLVIMFWTHVWSLVISFEDPQVRPFSCQEVSRIGIRGLLPNRCHVAR